MENYKPNSFKYREEQKAAAQQQEKKVEKVVSGPVTIKKKSGFRKFINSFISVDDTKKIKEYVKDDVVIPTIKKAITDSIINSINMLFYGEAGRNKNSNQLGTRVSYGKFYSERSSGSSNNSVSTSAYDFPDFIYPTRVDAERVLVQLEELISRYGFATIADLYDSAGKSTTNHCLNNYGWESLSNSQVIRVPEGYIIKLPNAKPIN